MVWKGASRLLISSILAASIINAQSVREHTRLKNPESTKVSDAQAVDVTLTLSTAARRPIQQVVRIGGAIDKALKVITGYVRTPESALVRVGQRVRSFPPQSKSSMYQAKITRVISQGDRVLVEATLAGQGLENSLNYVMEIIVERGESLSIPNEAIIEEGDRRVVYIQKESGHYLPQEIQTGFQGELQTEILKGLNEGDQVVTFGSFFIDSEYKLKATDQGVKR